MRRILLVVLSVVAVVAAAVSPAAAITYGEPDAGEHPYVGFMIYYVPAESAWYSCSGTLVDANTIEILYSHATPSGLVAVANRYVRQK